MKIENFSTLFRELLQASRVPRISPKKNECQTFSRERCSICPAIAFSYPDEVEIKNEAFRQFWRKNSLPGVPEPLVVSPMGRGYRTHSKRRALTRNRQVLLGLTDISESGKIRPVDVIACPIEPEDHSRIYNFIQQFIVSRDGRALAEALNYVIIKGNYDAYSIILNIKFSSSPLNALMNRLSKQLTGEFKKVTAVFSVLDEPSKYYLSNKANSFRKIFGGTEIYQEAGGKPFLYSPLAFSQTNGSMIDLMIRTIFNLMHYRKSETLYDLYCGYGLFALSAADHVQKVIGVEISKEAVQSARDNARRQGVKNSKFICGAITAESLQKIFPAEPEREAVILDPPRNGTDKGVIEFLARREVKKAVHVFCEVDLIPLEMSRWQQNGYRISKIVPLDLFPATDNVETIVLLERK